MLTKREIYQATGISDSTFLHWRRLGLIPAPAGIRKREALFSDNIVERIKHIIELQKEGEGLSSIHERLKKENEAECAAYSQQQAVNDYSLEYDKSICNFLNVKNHICLEHIDFGSCISCAIFTEENIILSLVSSKNGRIVDSKWSEKLTYEELGLFIGKLIKKEITENLSPPMFLTNLLVFLYCEKIEKINKIIYNIKAKSSVIKFAKEILIHSNIND